MNFIKDLIMQWKIKRALLKATKMMESLCDEAPASFFRKLKLVDDKGVVLDHIDARNAIMRTVHRVRADLK